MTIYAWYRLRTIVFEGFLDAPRSSCVCWRHSRCSLEHLRVGELGECLMDAHDIHPVDIVYIPHALVLHTLGGYVFVRFWLPPLLGFLPSDDISHTGGAPARCVLGFVRGSSR